MVRLAFALVLLGLLPAAASAAPFGELPAQAVKDPARCLRATGAPGEVVGWAPEGAEVVEAGASGFRTPLKLPLGQPLIGCPVAAGAPSGAAVVVQQVVAGIGVAVRDPGGAWGPPQTIERRDAHIVDDIAAAVSPRGDVAVAWTEISQVHGELAARVLVERRPAGGSFGAPVELQKLTRYRHGEPVAALGMQDDGTVLALWNPDDPQNPDRELVLFASAAPGAPFGAPQRLSSRLDLNDFTLTVAPDGRALATVDEGAHTRVLERPPGGAFARVASIGYTDTDDGPVAVALRGDGAAVVAWQDLSDLRVFAMRRDRPGPFGRTEPVAPAPRHPYGAALADFVGAAPPDIVGRGVRAAFAGDGRPVLTWAPSRALGALDWAAATVATFPGGVQTLGGPLRDADSVTPVILADGTPAVAWSDVSGAGDPRLHLALENASPAAAPAAPRVDFGRVEQIPHGLAVPFRCSAACDVRAAVAGGVGSLGGVGATGSLTAAGSGRLKIVPGANPIVLRRADSVPVQVLSGAPGASAARSRTLTARLRPPSVPPLLGVTAVRHGKRIAVSWHTDRPLRHVSVIAVAAGSRRPADPFFGTSRDAHGGRRFHLSVPAILGRRFIQLYLVYLPDATERRIAVVTVR